MRLVIRSGDVVHELRERGQPGAAGRRVEFEGVREATAWLSRVLADPGEAMRLRRLAGSLAYGAPAGDDVDVLGRLAAALVSGRLVLVRLGPVVKPRRRPIAEARERDARRDDFELLQEARRDNHWIEIELVGEDGVGLPGHRCVLVDGAGVERSAMTDGLGVVRWTRLPPGTCRVSFPDLDADAWQEVAAREA